MPSRPCWSVVLLFLAVAACSRRTESSAPSAADRAAADSARVFARLEGAATPHLTLTIAGAKSPPLRIAQVSCTPSASSGDRLLQIEALGRTAQVSFAIVNPIAGTVPVTNATRGARVRSRVASVEVTIHGRAFADGIGRATLSSDGRRGTLTARGLDRMGTTRHHFRLGVAIAWKCE